jgi:glutaminyl-peptide cyclotransferase
MAYPQPRPRNAGVYRGVEPDVIGAELATVQGSNVGKVTMSVRHTQVVSMLALLGFATAPMGCSLGDSTTFTSPTAAMKPLACEAQDITRYANDDDMVGVQGGNIDVLLHPLAPHETDSTASNDCKKGRRTQVWAYPDVDGDGRGEYDGTQGAYVICSASRFDYEKIACGEAEYRPKRLTDSTLAAGRSQQAQALEVVVKKTFPHDANAFTQGLLWSNGRLFESTGAHTSQSVIRRTALETGAVETEASNDPHVFAEGLAKIGDVFVQLTWQNGYGFIWRLQGDTWELLGQFDYADPKINFYTEGWGACYDGKHLVMSDGVNSNLYYRNVDALRDPDAIKRRGTVSLPVEMIVEVTVNGQPVADMNELECVGGNVYANVWRTTNVYKVAPAYDCSPARGAHEKCAHVSAVIDASELKSLVDSHLMDTSSLPLHDQAVLNGIAYRRETQTFFMTGKDWPLLFEVQLAPAN